MKGKKGWMEKKEVSLAPIFQAQSHPQSGRPKGNHPNLLTLTPLLLQKKKVDEATFVKLRLAAGLVLEWTPLLLVESRSVAQNETFLPLKGNCFGRGVLLTGMVG